DLEQQLADVGVGAKMALVDGGADRAVERLLPRLHHRHERIAHRTWPVVELDRAADVDAARVDLDRDAAHPVVEQRSQAWQAARQRERRAEYLLLELAVVFADDRDLQLLARAEVGEDSRLAHPGDFGEDADRQALEAVVGGERERSVENRRTRLPALEERSDGRCRAGGVAGKVVEQGGRRHGSGEAEDWTMKTNDRAILPERRRPRARAIPRLVSICRRSAGRRP